MVQGVFFTIELYHLAESTLVKLVLLLTLVSFSSNFKCFLVCMAEVTGLSITRMLFFYFSASPNLIKYILIGIIYRI